MSTHNHEIINPPDNNVGSSYALSGKIMLSAIVVLFFVVILMFSLHIYARWYLLRARRRHSRNRRRSRRSQLVFYVDPDAVPEASRGLDVRVLKSLPVFTFSGVTNAPLECAVCLSEFEENESGRVLPKCNHSFHLECIDMWFHSHSTCPLCRASVEESVPVGDSVIITINEPSGSNQEATCQHEEGPVVTSAVSLEKKLSIEVPKRNIEGFLGESGGCDSGPSRPHKSPMMSQMLSFTRMLSRDRRVSGTSCSPSTIVVSDSDMERGLDETRQTQSCLEECDSVKAKSWQSAMLEVI